MKKKFILITMLIVMFILSGCSRQEYEVVIGDSNSVTFTITAIIDKESYNLLSSFGIDISEIEKKQVEGTGTSVDNVNTLFQETAMLFNSYGFDITPLNDAVEIGFKAKKSYLTIEEFNNEIKELQANNICGLDLDIQYVDTPRKKEYKAYGTLSYVIDPDLGFDDETIKGYFDKQYDSSGMICRVAIQMPSTTAISASDGTIGANGALDWQTSYDNGPVDVHIISEFHDNSMIYAFIAGGILVALVIGFFVLRSLKFKKDKKNSALKDEYEYEASEDNK